MPLTVPQFRDVQLRGLTSEFGVYALCDLDQIPIYVGQSFGGEGAGIRLRVRRHLTSARSDIVANRMLDVWEVAFVWAWPCQDVEQTDSLEQHLFCLFDGQLRLMN